MSNTSSGTWRSWRHNWNIRACGQFCHYILLVAIIIPLLNLEISAHFSKVVSIPINFSGSRLFPLSVIQVTQDQTLRPHQSPNKMCDCKQSRKQQRMPGGPAPLSGTRNGAARAAKQWWKWEANSQLYACKPEAMFITNYFSWR